MSTNPLAQSLLGNNYTEVDLTENAIITVGDDDLGVPSSNISTYSTSSTETRYTIGSDAIGNITNIGNVTMDWNGRRLESISQNGTEVVTYDYNIDGQRVKKTVNGVTTEYFYNGSILAGQKKGDDVLIFMYDNNGDIFGFTYNGEPYYYIKNAQNDVFLIVDENGYAQVLYQYDAWGVVTACYDATDFGLAIINPIMYRSYYVDLEMGMFVYYLNSRYYIADWGRFASADSYVQTGQGMLDKNMFAYCANNPVKFRDPSGRYYEISIPAQGDGNPEITVKDEPNYYRVTREGNTFTVTKHTPTSEEKAFAALVYSEAGGTNVRTKKAVAHSVKNRILLEHWTNSSTILEAISYPEQYFGYNNDKYKAALEYYDTGNVTNPNWNNSLEFLDMQNSMQAIIPVYYGDEMDFTGGIQYFHSFEDAEDWIFHEDYILTTVEGTEKFWFYRE